jgi:hypothetical protein
MVSVSCLTTRPLVHPPTKIQFLGSIPRRGMPPYWTPHRNTRLRPHCIPSAAWSLRAMRAVHSRLRYRPREQQYIPATPFSAPLLRKCCCSTLIHHPSPSSPSAHLIRSNPTGVLLVPFPLRHPQVQRVMHARLCNS